MKSTTFLTVALGIAISAAPPSARAQQQPGTVPDPASQTAAAYTYFMTGHLQEQEYEITSSSDASQASIEAYKKALEIVPDSPVVMERLAEVEAKSQHIRDAVLEAGEVLKIDPDNVAAHRLLAFIYYRALGDPNAGALQQENLEKAIAQFQAILKTDPTDLNASLMLARLYGFENRHEESEKILRGVIARDPDTGPALEQLSQLLLDQNRSQEAIDILKQGASDTGDPGLYDLLGDAYSQAKQYPDAEEAYRKAIDSDPDDPGHIHGLAEALLAQNKYADAIEQYKRLTQLEPGTAENYVRLAELYRREHRYQDSESSLERAKQLSPESVEVVYNQALLAEDQGHFDQATKLLSNAIDGLKTQSTESSNTNALAALYEQLGHAYQEAQNYPSAISTYQEMGKLSDDAKKRAFALEADAYRENHEVDRAIDAAKTGLVAFPKDRDLTTTLALLYGEKSDTAAGVKLLQGLLHGDESDQELYIDMAEVQERGHKYAEAEQLAEKAEQIATEPSGKQSAQFMLGVAYERQKKFDLAEQQFRKVLGQDPDNAQVLNYYGYMLANRGLRLDEATTMIQKALKSDPMNGAYMDSLGWAYFKQNKYAEAEGYLRQATERDRDDPTILSHLADVYLKTGQDDRAAPLLERSLDAWQKSSPADYEADKAADVEAKLKGVRKRLAQKSSPDTGKPQ
jgi:tetratricopeptide (TPR) repeat protein